MLGQSYFQLISPLIFLVFSLGFILLWHYARDIRALPYFAVAYFIGSCALIGDFLRDLLLPDIGPYLINATYLATTVVTCAGLYVHYRRRVPWAEMLAFCALVFAGLILFRYRYDSISLRTWVINTGVVLIFATTLWHLRGSMRHGIDRALQGVITASAVLLMARTAVVLWYVGDTLSDGNYAGSVAAVTLHFCVAVAALATAGVLFAMFGMDIIRRITETSETDPLTGILNRRGFETRISALGAGHFEHAIVMADIDRFKVVNDTFGHQAGDTVIRALAGIFRDIARDSDYVVRWGGEEFLVLIANADTATARLFAETVRTRLETLSHQSLGGRAVTASFGIAAWRSGQTMADAGRQADLALYRAKREGRNRVAVDGPDIASDETRPAVA